MDVHKIYSAIFSVTRKQRMKLFQDLFAPSKDTKIIDVGGLPYNWQYIPEKPQITLVNLGAKYWKKDNIHMEDGDGTNLRYDDFSFDIAYSNSVIEHVGDRDKQRAFANEISRVAPKYFVQTPNSRFFIEPHYLAPFIHYFPKKIQRVLIKYFSVLGLTTRLSQEKIDEMVENTRLLNQEEMRDLFPDSVIYTEKFLGMTRSIIAVRL